MFKKRKLTLRQVHELYILLRPCLPSKEKEYLLDEMDWIMERMTEETMRKILGVLKINPEKKNGIQVLTLFIRELKANNFFEYVTFLQGVK